MKIHKEGHTIIFIVFFLLVLLNIESWLVFHTSIRLFILIISACLLFIIAVFFRDSNRIFTGDTKDIVVAPADGKIINIEEIFDHEYFQDKKLQISIFMGINNIHINWIPTNGEVIYYLHRKGRYQAAYHNSEMVKNEHSIVVIKRYDGERILVRQIAGILARRISTYVRPNHKCHINDRLGFIKFGSRVDLLLPLTSKILVTPNQKVQGNNTVLACLK